MFFTKLNILTAESANSCADCLSHLSIPITKFHPTDKGNAILATNCVNLPVSGRDSAILTAKDKILALVYASAQHGTWPFPMLEELPPFTMRKMHQPSMLDASFGRGMLLHVPMHEIKLHSKLLGELQC